MGWHHMTVIRSFDHLFKCSSSTCDELGWGGKRCGASANEAAGWQCTMDANLAEAKDLCESVGARLCTAPELAARAGSGSGCSLNSHYIWSQSETLGDLVCSDGDAITVHGNGNAGNDAVCRSGSERAAGVRCCADEDETKCTRPIRNAHVIMSTFVDGAQISRKVAEQPVASCEQDASCQSFLATVGANTDGSGYFPLPLYGLRLFHGNFTEVSSFAPQPFHDENSRWLKISKGLDGVDITW